MGLRGKGGRLPPDPADAGPPPEDIFGKIKEQALAEGFAAVGITRPGAVPEIAAALEAFVA